MSRVIQKAPEINLAALKGGKLYDFHLRDGRVRRCRLTGKNVNSAHTYELTELGVSCFNTYTQNGFFLSSKESSLDIIQITEARL